MSMQKDNLTDLVQNIPQPNPAPVPTPAPNAQQQVVTSSGETVTLGQNGQK
jgi:hypothetical protein